MTLNNVTKINTEEDYNLIYLDGELRAPFSLSFARPDLEKGDWDELKKSVDKGAVCMEQLIDIFGAIKLTDMIVDGSCVYEKPWRYLDNYSEIFEAETEYIPDLI